MQRYVKWFALNASNPDKTKEFLSKEVKVIDITLKEDLISNIDSKLEVTNKEIDEFLTEGLEKVDSN